MNLGVNLVLKKWPVLMGKWGKKYQNNAKWPKITYPGLILVPEVAFWGVLGASLYWKVVLEFWYGHPKCNFCHFGVPKMALWVPKSKFPKAPKTPQKATSGTKIGPQKVIFGHFFNFAYFYVVFPLARAFFSNAFFFGGQKTLFEVRFWFLRWPFGGFGG